MNANINRTFKSADGVRWGDSIIGQAVHVDGTDAGTVQGRVILIFNTGFMVAPINPLSRAVVMSHEQVMRVWR